LNRALIGILWIAASILFTCGCTKEKKEAVPQSDTHPVTMSPTENSDERPVIVAFGNSLTAGAGVDPAQNYPSKLQVRIDASGYSYRVVNSGVSGDTSSQGLNRIESIVALRPAIVIVELGANDGLRGLPPEATRKNLAAIINRLQSAGARVILAGMQMPPNYGPQYTGGFRALFQDLSKQHRTPLIPFFLEGVGGHGELNQDDGIHPTAEGYDIVVENVWKVLHPLLRK
jgi:acyl-CoA thioesterase I